MRWYREQLQVQTTGRRLYVLDEELKRMVGRAGVQQGMLHVFVHHTSASLLIQENADPAVLTDLDRWFTRLVVDGDPLFEHTEEGPDDMSAHVRAALTQSSLTIPLEDGAMALGTWQGVFLFEHRTRPNTRRLTLTAWGP